MNHILLINILLIVVVASDRQECVKDYGCERNATQNCVYIKGIWVCVRCQVGQYVSQVYNKMPHNCSQNCKSPLKCVQILMGNTNNNFSQCWKCKCSKFSSKEQCENGGECYYDERCVQVEKSGCWKCKYAWWKTAWFYAIVAAVGFVILLVTIYFIVVACLGCFARRQPSLRRSQTHAVPSLHYQTQWSPPLAPQLQ